MMIELGNSMMLSIVLIRNSRAMASAQPMSLVPLREFRQPGMSLQAPHRLPIVIPIPISELASKKAFKSMKRWGGRISRWTSPDWSLSVHQSRSLDTLPSALWGMSDFGELVFSMASKPVRYALPQGSVAAAWSNLPYNSLTSCRLQIPLETNVCGDLTEGLVSRAFPRNAEGL